MQQLVSSDGTMMEWRMHVQGVKMAIHDKFGDEVDDVARVEEVAAGGARVEVPQVE
jgi:hypothetical protein